MKYYKNNQLDNLERETAKQMKFNKRVPLKLKRSEYSDNQKRYD